MSASLTIRKCLRQCLLPLPLVRLYRKTSTTKRRRARMKLSGNRTSKAGYDAGSSNLTVSLLTTHERLAHDTQVLATMSSSIATCQAVSKNKHDEAKACPHEAV